MSAAPDAKLEVRPARANDVRSLSEFFLEAWKEAGPGAMGFSGATDEAMAEVASEGFLKRRMASPNVSMFVAGLGAEVVGFASLRKVDSAESELSGIAVLERMTGRGVGSRLLRKALEAARRRGVRVVTVKTEGANLRAIGFYKKAGFTETGRSTEKVGREKVLLQRMSKRLR